MSESVNARGGSPAKRFAPRPCGRRAMRTREVHMKRYVCSVCGYVYDEEAGDPDNGIAPGTKWEDLPEDWVCPLCGAGKENFEEE